MTLHLRNARYIDWRTRLITVGDLRVDPGAGGTIEINGDVPAGAEVIDCDGAIVTRSFVNSHHHIYSTLARGMPPPPRRPRSFVEILELIWWRLDKALDTEMIRASARAAAVEAARNGCTFIIDHHASPSSPEGSLHVIAEALDEIGVSHLLCYELSDRDGPELRDAAMAETKAYLGRHQGLVGLHASFTVEPPLLEQAIAIAREFRTGVHVHVAEAKSDRLHCRREHDCALTERFADTLNMPQTLLAHCLHLEDDERRRIRDSEAWVVHNTQSNQNNGVGAFKRAGLGDRVLIGTDGMHGDMPSATRAAYLEGAAGKGGFTPLQAYQRLRRAHDYLATNGFAGDGENNLVVLDYRAPTPVSGDNWPAHFVYGLNGAHVRTVISDGRVIVRDRILQTADEDAILAEANVQAERLWQML